MKPRFEATIRLRREKQHERLYPAPDEYLKVKLSVPVDDVLILLENIRRVAKEMEWKEN